MVLINSKYEILQLLGEGTFGKIYEGINTLTNELIAIKIQKTLFVNILKNEANMYNRCKNIKGIPKLRNYGVQDNYNYLILDKLGNSLENIKDSNCDNKIDLRNVLLIGLQIINILESIHNIGIIHRDIKPDNILCGIDKNKNKYYLIDFGISRYYINNDGIHNKLISNKKPLGTINYISLNVQNGIEASRRDDLESVGYILIYCLKGSLPWQNVSGNNKEDRYNNVFQLKQSITLIELCKDIPFEFVIFMDYCRKLNYDEKPNYNYLKQLLINLSNLYNYNISDLCN